MIKKAVLFVIVMCAALVELAIGLGVLYKYIDPNPLGAHVMMFASIIAFIAFFGLISSNGRKQDY